MGQRAVVAKLVGDLLPAGAPPEYLPETIAEAEENSQRCVISTRVQHVATYYYYALVCMCMHTHPTILYIQACQLSRKIHESHGFSADLTLSNSRKC